MKKLILMTVLLSGLILAGGFAENLSAQSELHKKISAIVKAETQYDLFSGTVLVAKDGEVVYSGAFGEANKETGDRITLATRFSISSVQKTFIATVVIQLCQEGLIDLDDRLTRYYPECPWESAKQIRLRYLLNHTSGLADYRDNEEYQKNCNNYTSIDDVLPLVWKYPPAFTPGERFEYSNAGVLLLKGIIEKVTGKKLARAMEERIWKPLGMKNTTFYVGGDSLGLKASAYSLAADGESYERVLEGPSAYAGGGIYTTVGDLLKFDQALYTNKLLSEENRNLMFTPVGASPNYAYGWIVVKFGGTTVIYHSGGSGGFNSEFRRYPEKGYTVIVLSNYQGAASDLANKIDCMLLGLPYKLATEADLHFKRGMHLLDQGLYSKALQSFEKNISGSAPHMASLYQAARTRILGKFDQEKAIKLLDRYISLANESTRPSIAAAWWRKGVAFEQMGEIEKAIACHEKCLELDQGHTDAQAALKRLREPKTAAEARKIIIDGYRDWDRGRVALDRNIFEKMLAPGFTIQQPGRKLTRQEFIDGISVGRPNEKLVRYNTTVLTVQSTVDGWVAIIQEKVEIEAPGGNKGYSLRITRAGWKQEENRWLITYAETIGHENWTGGAKPPFPDWQSTPLFENPSK